MRLQLRSFVRYLIAPPSPRETKRITDTRDPSRVTACRNFSPSDNAAFDAPPTDMSADEWIPPVAAAVLIRITADSFGSESSSDAPASSLSPVVPPLVGRRPPRLPCFCRRLSSRCSSCRGGCVCRIGVRRVDEIGDGGWLPSVDNRAYMAFFVDSLQTI